MKKDFYCSATNRHLNNLLKDGIKSKFSKEELYELLKDWDYICIVDGEIWDFVKYWDSIHLKYGKQYQLHEEDRWIELKDVEQKELKINNFRQFIKELWKKFNIPPCCPFDGKTCVHYDGILCNPDCETYDTTKSVKF